MDKFNKQITGQTIAMLIILAICWSIYGLCVIFPPLKDYFNAPGMGIIYFAVFMVILVICGGIQIWEE